MHLLLYLLADPDFAGERPLLEKVAAALDGGVTAVQLRAKQAMMRETLALGQEMRRIARGAGAAFLVNDRPDLALALEADGVHVGSTDLPVGETRRLVHRPMVVGASAGSVDEAREAEEAGADYLGVGPVFATSSKADAGEPIGLESLAEIASVVRIPVVGIGGITLHNASSVIEAGAVGVAVISAILMADDCAQAARALRGNLEEAMTRRCLPEK
jgi:thiamine-phosphate pyrophosphorylase